MQASDFNYHLPKELIAQKPMRPRDHSRLMVMNRTTGTLEHRTFFELPKFLRKGDVLVLNDTKVFKARLFGTVTVSPLAKRGEMRRGVEIFLLRPLDRGWEALAQPARKLTVGSYVDFGEASCTVLKKLPDGRVIVDFNMDASAVIALADRIGHVPVPPYIHEEPTDPQDYQTVFAKNTGSVAAPTASFHFTEELLEKIRAIGVEIVHLTLHVGIGTFRPIKTASLEEHVMHEEWVDIPSQTADAINRAKQENRRVIAVGTTVVRALEGVSSLRGPAKQSLRLPRSPKGSLVMTEYYGPVNLFITPGFQFKIVDALITNFHLPKSTLLVLVSAFAGREHVLNAYREAVNKRYRFFSFGDAMFIL